MNDVHILKELACKLAEISELRINDEKKELWYKLNTLKPDRPMVMIDQLPWQELNSTGELTLLCNDSIYRELELDLRKKLFQYKYFPADMVIEKYYEIPSQVKNLGYGIEIKEETIDTDNSGESISSHKYIDLLTNEKEAMQIKAGKLEIDVKKQEIYNEKYHNVFDGIMQVKPSKIELRGDLWDTVTQFKSITEILYAIMDEPELIDLIMSRMRDAFLLQLDQLTELNMLKDYNTTVHCTGAYTHWEDKNGNVNSAKNAWVFSMSQLFATVSPAMHEEWETPYVKPIFERFGYVYYGCCEPLHDRIEMIKKYPNVRKISMSPWANVAIGAEKIGSEYVFSNKPNPAFLSSNILDEDLVRQSLLTTYNECKKYNCPLEFIQKDVSTVKGNLDTLVKWNKIAMQIACQ